MGRRRERGSAVLFVMGALAISAAVGVGVYVVVKERRLASAAEAAAHPEPPPDAALAVAPPVDPPEPEQPVSTTPPPPADTAGDEAIDPVVGSGPPETNAPMFGTPGVDGALDKVAIATAVRPMAGKLQRCFEQRLAAGAKIGGTMRVTLIVNRRGGVTEAYAGGVDVELGECVSATLKAVRFPKTSDGDTARIVYPIAFHSAAGDDEGDTRPRPPGGCDEVSCVLDNYTGDCCAKYRRGEQPATPSIQDEVPREELRTALGALRGKVESCAAQQEFTGVIKVKFKVLPEGKVSEVTVEDAEPALGGCIARAFKAYTFSASTNGVTARFPFSIQ